MASFFRKVWGRILIAVSIFFLCISIYPVAAQDGDWEFEEINRASAELKNGDVLSALNHLETVIEKSENPKYLKFAYSQGSAFCLLLGAESYKKGIEYGEKSLEQKYENAKIDTSTYKSLYKIARSYGRQEDFETAVELCLKYAKKAEKGGFQNERNRFTAAAIEFYDKAGTKLVSDALHVIQNEGDYEKGIESYKKALELCRKAIEIYDEKTMKDDMDICMWTKDAYQSLCNICAGLGSEYYGQTLNYAKKSLSIKVPSVPSDANAVLKEKHDKYEEFFVKSDLLSYDILGLVHKIAGDFNSSKEAYEKEMQILLSMQGENQNDSINEKINGIYESLADINTELGLYENALFYYEEIAFKNGLDFERKPEPFILACSLCSKICIYMNEMEKAEKYAKTALEKSEEFYAGDKGKIADAYSDYAGFLCITGKYEAAEDYYKKAQENYTEKYGKDDFNTAQTILQLAALYAHVKRNDEAKSLVDYFLSLKVKYPPYLERMYLFSKYCFLTEIADEIGDRELFLEYAPEFLNHMKKHSSVENRIRNSGEFLLFSKTASENPDEEKIISLKRNALKIALDAIDEGVQAFSEKQDVLLSNSLAIYYAGIEFALSQNEFEKAFAYSERLRSRGFLSEIGTKAALSLPELSESEKEKLSELMIQIKVLKAETEEKIDAEKIRNLDKLKKELSELEESIGKRVPKFAMLRNPKIVSLAECQKWCGEKRVVLEYAIYDESYSDGIKNNMLSNEKSALVDIIEDKPKKIRSYCLVITDKKIRAVEIEADGDIQKAIRTLREETRKGKGLNDDAASPVRRKLSLQTKAQDLKGNAKNSTKLNSIKESRKFLFEKLIAPVLAEIPEGTERIVIVPDGELSHIPFDILGDDEGEIFGKRFALSLSPAVSVSMMKAQNLNADSESSSAKGFSMLGIGNAVYDENENASEKRGMMTIECDESENTVQNVSSAGEYYKSKKISWRNIPGTGREMHILKDSVFSDENAVLYEGKETTESLVKNLSANGTLAKYPFVLLACHGHFEEAAPAFSSLVFSEVSGNVESNDDGYLTVQEFAMLNMNARFLNLSACETGLSARKKGDGMSGLARACMVSGADNVGVTLWEVNDEATVLFQTTLYSFIKGGMKYSEAYRKAKMSMMENDEFSKPVYWAAFTLYE